LVEIVRAAGGEIVADVDEAWTRPRLHPLGSQRVGLATR
jgi:hypothetical protein